MIKLVIDGEPVAQERPKFTTYHKIIKAYDPEKSRNYKKYVALVARQQYKLKPLTGALKISCTFYRQIQQSGSKAVKFAKSEHVIRPTVKPDIDNYFKCVTDALKGICWLDDNQIVDVEMHKHYDEQPRTEIEIRKVKG